MVLVRSFCIRYSGICRAKELNRTSVTQIHFSRLLFMTTTAQSCLKKDVGTYTVVATHRPQEVQDWQSAWQVRLDTFEESSTSKSSGSYAKVVKVTDQNTGEDYAMKIIEKSKCRGQEHHIVQEVNILKRLHHPNIIRLFDCFESKDKIYL